MHAGQGSLSDISVGISDINAIWLKVRRKSMFFRGVSLRVYKPFYKSFSFLDRRCNECKFS